MDLFQNINEYIELGKQIDLLVAERDRFRRSILDEMNALDMQELDCVGAPNPGNLTIIHRHAWNYDQCPDVLRLRDQLRMAEYQAQENGKAIPTLTPWLKFTPANSRKV